MAKVPALTSFAGIRNTVPVERLHTLPDRFVPTTDLAEAVNVDIDNSGQVARRAGTTLKVAGSSHSLWAQGDMCLFMQGTQLQRMYPDYSSEVLASGLTALARAAYVEVNGRVYWANEFESGIVADGRNRSWGMDIPASPGLSLAPGVLLPGQYLVAVTFLRDDMQESGAGLESVITLADTSGIRVVWQAPADSAIQRARVYVSEPNGTTLYLADDVPVDDLFTEVSTLASATPLNTQWQDKPPAGQALAYSRGRIFIARGEFIFGTTALGYEYVDLRDYLTLDGSRVRLLAGVEHGVFAATDHAAYFLAGDKFEDMEMRIISTQGGQAGSVVYVDGAKATGKPELAGSRCAMFTTGEGVFLGLPDGTVANLTQERYRFEAGVAAAAVFHENPNLNSYVLFLQP